ncbi:MAG: tetratricopeptide repeat protein [Candidatus Aminicenantes bacterium]|nr:tetratricopeptide repeat protein [Candidatus Aminicenantes bacterium]NIM80808.1 tetratricopeptide repeat protein [Candidatus Aminicenantes bacterium]NIN20191.1 tetratricopeptide repeat protein [Candidatus Aminicenantes bacterium]NIN43970.1 tetratricopeptide repeat protein [Candidatus Aminicenantes bacterium]NIN86779.1 tetratricopeptide repeat protein [Candidatus Aminicenantes bacterium]
MKKIAIITFMLVSLGLSGISLALSAAAGEDGEDKVYLPPANLNPETYRLLKNGQWEQAIEKLSEAYESINSDANLKYYLAFCYEQLANTAINEKRYQDAINQLESAVHYVKDQPRLYLGLGACYFSLSRYAEAERAFSQVLELQPRHFLAHKMLGEIYYLTNNMDDAREHWQAALKIKPGDDYTKKRLTGLKKYKHMAENFETEVDMMFSVSFNGTKKPQLRDLVLNMLAEISRELGQKLNLYPNRQIPVILLTNQAFFDITGSPKWAGGVYEGHIKVPVDNYQPGLLRIVLAHEYVHAVIFDRLSFRCPWWLNEGLAQYLSGDQEGNKRKLKLAVQFIKQSKVPPLEEMPGNVLKEGDRKSVQLAYALALSAVQYFVDHLGITEMQYVLDLMAEGKGFAAVISEITGYSFAEFQENWKQAYSQK